MNKRSISLVCGLAVFLTGAYALSNYIRSVKARNISATDINPDPNVFEAYLTAQEQDLTIGGQTVHAMVYKDDPPSLPSAGAGIPAPLIKLKVGETAIVHFKNNLPTASASIHWHGIELDNDSDGTAVTQDAVLPGQSYTYRFKAFRPGLFWYHSHMAPSNETFAGMYGPIVIENNIESSPQRPAVLPLDVDTHNLVISDIEYDANGNVGKPFPAPNGASTTINELIEKCHLDAEGQPGGNRAACAIFAGATVLVNGEKPDVGTQTPKFTVPAGKRIRLRLFNAALARHFRLKMVDSVDNNIYRIGGEGGLLDRVKVEGGTQGSWNTFFNSGEVVLGSGDRADVIVVPSGPQGSIVRLVGNKLAGSFLGDTGYPVDYPIAFFEISGTSSDVSPVDGGAILDGTGEDIENIKTAPVNPLVAAPPFGGSSDPTIRTTSVRPSPKIQLPSIDGFSAMLDSNVGNGDFQTIGRPLTARYAHVGDVLELSVRNETAAAHPFHMHGFSMQPVRVVDNASGNTLYTWNYDEFLDTIDVYGGQTLVYRMRIDDRPRSCDEASGPSLLPCAEGLPGGAVGRWIYHCHIFHHAGLGMMSEVTILPKPPSGAEKTVTTNEDSAYTFSAADFGFTDADGNSLTAVKMTTLPSPGTLTNNDVAVNLGDLVSVADLNSGKLKFAPAANANGNSYASFTFQVQDDGGISGLDLDLSPNTMTIDVTAVNDAPVATDDTPADVLEDSGPNNFAIATLVGNDNKGAANESGQTLNITAVSNPTGGTVQIVSTNVVFTPTANYNGPGGFDYTVQDDGTTNGSLDAKTDTGTVNFNVTAVNDAPTLDGLSNATIAEDAGLQTVNLTGIGAGGGESQTLTVTAVSNDTAIIPNPTVAYTSPNSTGSISYTPVANANGGPVTITLTVMDNGGTHNSGADSLQRQFTVTVTEVNDAPVATDDTPANIQEDSGAYNLPISTLVGNDNKGAANENLQTLDITAVSNPVGGTVQIVSTNVVFTPTANYFGPASFDYTVADNGTTAGSPDPKTDTGTVNFNVTALNDAPSFTKGADQTISIDAGPQTVAGWATSISQGPGESGQTPLTFNVVAQSGATVTFLTPPAIDGTTGTLTYTANNGSSGTATFDVTLSDSGPTGGGNVNTSAIQSFTITVVPTLALTVNSSGDEADNNLGDRICDTSAAPGDQCTLRAAIQETNGVATADTIDFNLPANTTITLLSALDDINGDLVITGPPSGVTVSGNNMNRVFRVQAGKTVSILNLTIANGRSNVGGGILNSGNLTISNSTFTGNQAVGGVATGGAIYSNNATLTIINSTISGNSTDNAGGGLYNSGTSTANLINVTITNNRAEANSPAPLPGGGGGIRQTSSNPVTLRNTIVAGNFTGMSPGITPDDISGNVNAASNNNLIGTFGSSGLTNGVNNNQLGVVDARLGALASNGGPTQTHALLSGSVALDAGDNSVTGLPYNLSTDQRGAGFPRQADGPDANTTDTVEIGAFEADPSVEDISDKSTNEDTALPSFVFNVGDSSAAFTSIAGTSSNTTLVPDANIEVGANTASTRTLSITPAANQFGTATITVTVTRGTQSMADTFVLTVNGVNDPPSFVKGADQTVAEDAGAQSVPGWATAISQGPNESGQTLTFLVQNNTNPSLFSAGPAISSTGTLTYTPAADANGTAAITIALKDSGGGTDTSGSQTFNITVTEVNDAPDAVNDPLTSVAEDSGMRTISIALLLANDTKGAANESGQTLTFSLVAASEVGGTISSDATNVYFTPTANFNGAASFQYQVTDNGTTNSLADPKNDTATVSFTITEVNDAPTAVNDTIANSAEDSGPRTITAATLTGNDSKGPANESGQTLIIKTVGSAVGGTVSIVSGNVVFTPTADYNGPASFQYTVEDNGTTNGAADPKTSGTATVNFTIMEVNDVPDAINDGLTTVAEDSAMRTISIASLLANDTKGPANESGQTLTLTGVSNPVGGTVTNDATNVYFTPAADFNGTASFQYTATDNGTTNGAADPKSDTATVSFTVTEVNDAPIPEDNPLGNMEEDAPQRTIPFSVLTNNDSRGAANESGQTLIVKTVSNPIGLTVSIVAGTVRFTPLPNYHGPASFRYTIEDNGTTNGAADPKTSATSALAHFNITPVADTPSVTNATTNANTQTTSGLVISRNPADGVEVTHFKITGITNGLLFKNDGTTPINNGDFITFAEGNAGLKFTPGTTNGSFTVQASLSASDAGLSSLSGGTAVANIIINPLGGVIRFSSATYSVAEDAGFRTITVERSGDTSRAVTVDYVSSDHSTPADFIPCNSPGAGFASSRCDFTTAIGTLKFAAGETTKTFNVLINQDNYVEGTETLSLTLSNPSGGAVFGVPQTATLEILDDVSEPATNPIDNAADFVKQQYRDILHREADGPGLAFWTDNIEKCNDPARRPAGQTVAQCIDKQRESTAIAFFMSPEFHITGGYVFHLYKGSLTGPPNYDGGSAGRFPTFLEFMHDVNQVSEGIVVGNQISGAVVEANRNALATEFVQRPEFIAKYGGLNNTLYVQELFNTTGITPTAAEKQALVDGLNNSTETRASVLRKVVDGTVVISESNVQFTTTYGQAFYNQEYRRLFVYLEYVGYLRRNPDAAGFVFWLGKLNSFNGDPFLAEMVRSFILSPEYRSRFGQP